MFSRFPLPGPPYVIPAQAGIHGAKAGNAWIPAYAGMTSVGLDAEIESATQDGLGKAEIESAT